MAIPALSDWPQPESSLLAGIVDSISARSKAFKTKTGNFDIAISTESTSGSTYERLNLRLDDLSPNPNRLSFVFWEDGVMRVDARQSSQSGWQYEFSFYADFKDIDSDTVRDTIERSLWISDNAKLQTVWREFEPYTK